MNINMLRDVDNDPGFYAAACGSNAQWKGATLLQSTDGGATFQTVTTITSAATIGKTLDALGNFNGGNLPDEINSVTVRLTFGELESIAYAAFINEQQAAIIGDEIVFFRDAILNVDGTYTLRGFLRGRRGTEYAMNTHAAGERFILVNSALRRIAATTADLGRPKKYKVVTADSSTPSTDIRDFTNQGAGLKPYSPVQVGGGRDADGNLVINWVRRTRISGEWRDNVDVPISEEREAYDVEIWSSDGATLKRTMAGLTAPTASYSAADQTADFGSAQPSVRVRVYQLSGIVGRGYAAQAFV